jgi:hypothetical protein
MHFAAFRNDKSQFCGTKAFVPHITQDEIPTVCLCNHPPYTPALNPDTCSTVLQKSFTQPKIPK